MSDIVNGDKIVIGNNSRMIKIEIKNNFGSNSEGNNPRPDSVVTDAEEAEFEEVEGVSMESSSTSFVPLSDDKIKKIVRFPSEYTKQTFRKIVNDFYLGDAVNLALIEIVLYDHNQLMNRSNHTPLLNLLITWGILSEDLDIKKTANGMSQKMKPLPTEPYEDWDRIKFDKDRKYCLKIGAELPDSMPYGRSIT